MMPVTNSATIASGISRYLSVTGRIVAQPSLVGQSWLILVWLSSSRRWVSVLVGDYELLMVDSTDTAIVLGRFYLADPDSLLRCSQLLDRVGAVDAVSGSSQPAGAGGI